MDAGLSAAIRIGWEDSPLARHRCEPDTRRQWTEGDQHALIWIKPAV